MNSILGAANTGANDAAAVTPAGGWIKDSSTATFMADVIEASMQTPVVVDFWAPWCGPCKQLGPTLEKIVNEAKGAVRLVKINVDENQQLAQQMRIQSIPAVYAFKGGRPVDGFMGALPETQVRQFVAALGGTAPETEGIKEALAEAQALLEQNQAEDAAAVFSQVLETEPENAEAYAGLAKSYLAQGDKDNAREILANAPDAIKSAPQLAAVKSALELADAGAQASGNIAELADKVAKDPKDHQARFDLALAHYAAGAPDKAIDELLESFRRDRNWNEAAARAQLLKIFEALGPTHELTVGGRRRLSSILFS
ncbi:MAG TPA: thioredoxin [Alphaproteobacteria bacterium]|jgi:putative thioredoxin|nr:thioredoxin [Alphaproteobacteria bacterium]